MSHMISPLRVSRLFNWLVNGAKTQGDIPEASTLSAEGQCRTTGDVRDWHSSLVRELIRINAKTPLIGPDFIPIRKATSRATGFNPGIRSGRCNVTKPRLCLPDLS